MGIDRPQSFWDNMERAGQEQAEIARGVVASRLPREESERHGRDVLKLGGKRPKYVSPGETEETIAHMQRVADLAARGLWVENI